MFRLTLSGLALALLTLAAGADDKKDKKDTKPGTVWLREANGVDLSFEIGKDNATFNVFVGENGVIIKAKVSKSKDVVTAEFTDVEEKGNFPNKPKKGDKISFKWVEKDGVATLSEFKGPDEAREIIEGEYKPKK